MKVSGRLMGLVTLVVVIGATVATASAQTTETVTGTVKDAQGAVVPGATVTLISEARGTSLDTQTAATGDFVFTNVAGDTYTVRVTMNDFKTSERNAVNVSPASQLQLNSPTDLTVRNPQFNADGTLNQARLKPKDAGFGAATAAQPMRSIQGQLRFQV